MGVLGWIALYSAAIITVSLVGGSVPLLGRVTHSKLQMYLSLSAGVMLGASFFHVMPDAFEKAGETVFGWSLAFGVIGLFCIERFIAPHSHETSSKLQQEHEHEPGCEHDHEHHAAPAVAGWMAVLGLTVHTFMNGVALAAAIKDSLGASKDTLPVAAAVALPGWAMFLAIALHKPADALAISTVLSRNGVRRRKLALVQFGFASMIPLGAAAYMGVYDFVAKSLDKGIQDKLTGAVLAFSAGTFLFIALSDLLPEVQFHQHDRFWLFSMLVAGVAFMGGIAWLEDLGGAHGHNHASHAAAHNDHDHDKGGDHHDDDGDSDHDHDEHHQHAH
jgi:zinc and cadmium transporter